MSMDEQTTEFDWSPLGSAFWDEAKKTTGASDLQVRFACCRHRGMTAVGSAKAAGYAGDADSIRQAGSRAAKSTAVMAMVQLAQIEQAGGDDGTLGGPEARRILSKLARGSDPSVRIKAIETLNRIDREERANRSPEPEVDPGVVVDWVFGLFKFEYDLLQQSTLGWDDCFRAIVREMDATTPSAAKVNGATRSAIEPEGAADHA
jgi:hypothetical protein